MTSSSTERRPRRADGDRGLTVVEVVMAVAVIALAASMAMVVLSSSAKSELTTKQGDQGLSFAEAALENAAVFDCGATTAMLPTNAGDMTNPAFPTPGVLTTRYQRCVPTAKNGTGDLGDARWKESANNIVFDVVMRTNWVQFDPVAHDTGGSGGGSGSSDLGRANLRLRRDIVVTWRVAGRTRTRRLSQLGAPPPDAIAGANGGSLTYIRVPDANGAPGTVTLSLGRGFTVTHSADAHGVVRFPFLEVGTTYNVSVNGVPRTPLTPSQSNPDVVRQL